MSKVSKFNITLVFVACLLCALFCTTAFADEAETDVGYTETPVYIDGLLSFRGYTVGDTTYLPLECTCAVLGFESESNFDIETNTLTVKVEDIEITVCKDDEYICANGRYFYLPDGYMEIDGSAVVPIDAIERIFTLEAKWDAKLEAYDLDTANKAILISGTALSQSPSREACLKAMYLAKKVGTRVLFIDDGQILEDGTPEQIFEHPQNPRTQNFLNKVLNII